MGRIVTFDDVDGDIEAQFFGVPTGTNEVAPAGYQVVHRTAIVRLGADLHVHTSDHHGSLGIVSVEPFQDSAGDWNLKVTTDFDETRELVMLAIANPDQSLVKKGLLPAGASGGGATALCRLQSTKTIYYGTSSSKAAGTALPPQSNCFNSAVDNIWVHFLSLRALV